ncbi:MAG: class I SAM-dependent methyltransferase [Chloroflexota bacterium]
MANDNTTAHKAAGYDQQVQQVIPFYRLLHDETIDLVRAVKPQPARWLDTGAGTGALIETALPYFAETQFLLADPSEEMLAEASHRFAAYPAQRVHILPAMDSLALPTHQPALCPMVITAMMSHHYLQPFERRDAVQACYRLLAPEGLFVTFENIDRDSTEGRQIGLQRWKQFQIAQGRSPEVAARHLTRFNTEYFPITVSAHLALLKETGFRVVELFWHSHMQAGFYALK